MQPLPSLIHDLHPPSNTLTTDTIFEQSLTTLFGDARNQHGEPGESVLYTPQDPQFLKDTNGGVDIASIRDELGMGGEVGEGYVADVVSCGRGLKLRMADAVGGETKLFANFVWNAAILAAEMLIASAPTPPNTDLLPPTLPHLPVSQKRILELGAGTALPSLTATLLGAQQVTITDYPSAALISNIATNIAVNIPAPLRKNVEVWGHEWGVLDTKRGSDSDSGMVDERNWVERRRGYYDVVIAADCMWMGDQHLNLANSIYHFVSPSGGKVLAIAGFHTGRAKVGEFFKTCQRVGLRLESIVEVGVEGEVREWREERGGEDPVERKRWLTVGVLGK